MGGRVGVWRWESAFFRVFLKGGRAGAVVCIAPRSTGAERSVMDSHMFSLHASVRFRSR